MAYNSVRVLKLNVYISNGAVPLHILLKNNFEWTAFHRLNCFCYYFISPLKAKESKLEMQKTFVAEFAEAELKRKSNGECKLVKFVVMFFLAFLQNKYPTFCF